jgi:signal peptidase I
MSTDHDGPDHRHDDAPLDEPRPREPQPVRKAGAGKRRRPREHRSFLVELPIIMGIALVLSLLIKTFLVQAFFIPSASMEQTLIEGDRVFVNKLATTFGDIERGDVVVFKDPGEWLFTEPRPEGGNPVSNGLRSALEFVGLAPSSDDDDLIKRVIGVAGDNVVCCDDDGRVTVNGTPLDEDYLFPGDSPSELEFDVTVPEDSLWVMGDHRGLSEDSRYHQDQNGGMVPLDNVVGRAFVIVWPFDRFGGLGRPDTFDDVAPAGR